jgi:hypothetical protein
MKNTTLIRKRPAPLGRRPSPWTSPTRGGRGQRSIWGLFCCALAATLLSACTSTYSEKNVTQETPPILRSHSRVYVAIPFDASFKEKVAQGSGKSTAQAFFAAFSRHIKGTYLSLTPESLDEALDNARRINAEYLVYPNIMAWEDRATEWSGRRDRLELKVDLIDLRSSRVVFSREISATGKWMTDGGDSPNDLLIQPAEQYVNAVFRRIERPTSL